MAKTKKFPRDIMLALIFRDKPEGLTLISDTLVDHRRWSVDREIIFKEGEKFYSASYSRGATENQDERPWEYESVVEATEVVPKEVTKIEYVVVP